MVESLSGSIDKAAVLAVLLRTARGERSQSWVMEQTGLTERTVRNLETGATAGRPYNIAAYARAVGLTAQNLEAVGRDDAARELDALVHAGEVKLSRGDRRLLADLRAKKRTFRSHAEWIAWVRRWAPDLLPDSDSS